MVLSEYWKRLEENFGKRLFPRFPKKWWNLQKKISSLFQFSERTITNIEINNTSAKSPWTQLEFGTLKVGVAWSRGRHVLSREKHNLLNFTAARRVFDFLTSMTSIEVNFKDTSTFRVSFESWNKGLFADVTFISIVALVLSEYLKALDSGNDFRTVYWKKITETYDKN